MMLFSHENAMWSHPVCWETSGVKGAPQQDSLYRDVFIIGDIHGTIGGLIMLLNAAGIIEGKSCLWNEKMKRVLLIQMGDVVDRGKYSTESYSCLEYLQQTAPAFSSRVVRLLGNHELLWLSGEYNYRNKVTDSTEKIISLTKQIMIDILAGNVQGAFSFNEFCDIPILFTHAGLRMKMRSLIESSATHPFPLQASSIDNASFFALHINNKLQHDIGSCRDSIAHFYEYEGPMNCGRFLVDEIYSAGPERGGSNVGGTFWTDFSILLKESSLSNWDFMQIVGHSLKIGEIRSSEYMTSICVDAGLMAGGRAYLQLSPPNGRVFAHEWKKRSDEGRGMIGGWETTDFTTIHCQHFAN